MNSQYAAAAERSASPALLESENGIHPLVRVPDFDHAEYSQESPEARTELHRWQEIITAILYSSNGKRAAEIRRLAVEHGMTVRMISYVFHEKWSTNRATGRKRDWRSLIDRRRFPLPVAKTLPFEFVEHVKTQMENRQRSLSAKQVFRDLVKRLDRWERGDTAAAIPGYEFPPRRLALNNNLPKGWSYSNIRALKPNRYEATLRKRGPKEATRFLPGVLNTRAGLGFGEVFFFDDSWHDTKVNFLGINNRELRPVSFNALEALSGFNLMGLKCQIWDPEEDKRRGLTEIDFFWFVVHVLSSVGYNRERGTTLIFEHGTANTPIDAAIGEVTGGKVQIARSGVFGAPAFREMLFEGRSTGNFRFKAPIESFFNLVRNYSDHLPGAAGKDFDHLPEEDHGRGAYNKELLALATTLPPAVAAKVRFPYMDFPLYSPLAHRINAAINARRDHQLEGWEKCGHTSFRWRMTPESAHWAGQNEFAALPPAQREIVQVMLSQPGCCERYQLSPAEVFEGHRESLTRLPDHAVPIIAPERVWREVRVGENLTITIQDQWIDPEPMVYYGVARNPWGRNEHLDRGRRYLALLNPFAVEKIWLMERDGSRRGAFIGVAHAVPRGPRTSRDAALAQIKNVSSIRSREDLHVRERSQEEAFQRAEDARHNERLIAGREGRRRDASDRAGAALDAMASGSGGDPADFDEGTETESAAE